MPTLPVVDVDIADQEVNAVADVVKSRFLIEGKHAREFEAKFSQFTGAKHVTTVCNGTCALHLALSALGIGPGDEVITTPFTFIASSNTITFNGGIPIFVDVDKETFNIDPEKIEMAITARTKAIMPVHIFGNPCDMKAIMEIAEDHDLAVIEDCAQAHDARIDGQHTGTFGDIAAFSFYGTKNLVGGEGGAVVCNSSSLFEKVMSLKNHGRNPKGGYEHYQIGYNYRTTDMSAAIMNVQMDRAHDILARRHRNGDLYRSLLEDQDALLVQKHLPGHQMSDYIFAPAVLKENITPDRIIDYLKSKDISSRTIYTILNYEQPAYRNIDRWPLARVVQYPDYTQVHCPNAEFIARHHFELPMVTSLSDENIAFIVETLLNFLE